MGEPGEGVIKADGNAGLNDDGAASLFDSGGQSCCCGTGCPTCEVDPKFASDQGTEGPCFWYPNGAAPNNEWYESAFNSDRLHHTVTGTTVEAVEPWHVPNTGTLVRPPAVRHWGDMDKDVATGFEFSATSTVDNSGVDFFPFTAHRTYARCNFGGATFGQSFISIEHDSARNFNSIPGKLFYQYSTRGLRALLLDNVAATVQIKMRVTWGPILRRFECQTERQVYYEWYADGSLIREQTLRHWFLENDVLGNCNVVGTVVINGPESQFFSHDSELAAMSFSPIV